MKDHLKEARGQSHLQHWTPAGRERGRHVPTFLLLSDRLLGSRGLIPKEKSVGQGFGSPSRGEGQGRER